MSGSTKPNSIVMFNKLNLAATLMGIANTLVHYSALRSLAISKGASPAGPILGIILVGLSYLIFWFFIFRRGSRAAKWLFVAATMFAVGMIPRSIGEVIAMGVPYAVIDGTSFVLQLAAAAMLFRSDAKDWLAHKNHEPAPV